MSDEDDDIDNEEEEDDDEEDEEEEQSETESQREAALAKKKLLVDEDIAVIKDIFSFMDDTSRRLVSNLKLQADIGILSQVRDPAPQKVDLSWMQYENLDELQRIDMLEKAIRVLNPQEGRPQYNRGQKNG
jgi:hypothetical protein